MLTLSLAIIGSTVTKFANPRMGLAPINKGEQWRVDPATFEASAPTSVAVTAALKGRSTTYYPGVFGFVWGVFTMQPATALAVRSYSYSD